MYLKRRKVRNQKMNKKAKLSMGKIVERFSYGCGDFGCNIIYTAMSAFLVFYYTDYAGVNALAVGTIMMEMCIRDRNKECAFAHSLFYISALICKIFKKIKICIMLMQYPVSTSHPDECPCKFPIFTIPVSYTHLDVYKRQLECRLFICIV